MIDTDKLFPMQAILPVVGGVLVWFGLNYIFLAPSVVGPRLAEKYYRPQCETVVTQAKAEMQARMENDLSRARNQIIADLQERGQAARAAPGNFLGALMQAYGAEGQAFMDMHGDTVREWGANQAEPYMPMLEQQANEMLAGFHADQAREVAQIRAQQKYSTPAEFCGCNVTAALADNFDLALHSSSLRLYKPASIKELESGTVFDQCGPIPVV